MTTSPRALAFAAWDHETGEDAVYVAWHTNALNGTAVGTEVYVYGPNPVDGTLNFTGVPGSDVLGQSDLANELERTSRPPWIPTGGCGPCARPTLAS